MNNIKQFEKVIDYIEQHLDEELETEVFAKMLNLSVYEFRRIFSFIAGVPIGEYLRKRRLSVAAQDFISKKYNVTEAAKKWGYDSPSSFTRAFKSFHGCSPNEIQNHTVNMFTKITLFAGVSGGTDFPYRLIRLPKLNLNGISGISDDSDTECCENVWTKFYDEENGLIEKSDGEIYAVYKNCGNFVECFIGIKGDFSDKYQSFEVPQSLWVCFDAVGTDDAHVNEIYSKILTEWMDSGKIKLKKNMFNIEIFPKDMETDEIKWKIMFPVEE